MKKIYILFIFLLLISSCSNNKNNEEELIVDENKNVETIVDKDSESNSNEDESNSKDSFLNNTVGTSVDDIIGSYYDGDVKYKIAIKTWLGDDINEKSSFAGDVIEFLDYCENYSDDIDNISKLQDSMISNDIVVFKEITNGIKKLDDIEFRKLFDEYLSSSETGELSVIYGTMLLDVTDGKNIECKEYIKDYSSN